MKTRPPIVAIMGHVDHGKSTLLDFIRKTNIVAGEAGGITQYLSAYEVSHTTPEGYSSLITFIDTPGHAAFSGMRSRGATIADIAILIVSAVEGIKPQTLEALKTIKENNVPFVVAVNKIDLPDSNVDRVLWALAEHEVYCEGYGGDTPVAKISAKKGTGVSELLDMILLVAQLENFEAEEDAPAEGFVIEAHRDDKKGISATLIIKKGTLKRGDIIVAGLATTPSRILLDTTYQKPIESATFSTPVSLVGFDNIPEAGSEFIVCKDKKEAENFIAETRELLEKERAFTAVDEDDTRAVVPLIIKADVAGTREALESIIETLSSDRVLYKIVHSGVGTVSEADIKLAMTDNGAIIIAFNVGVDKAAADLAQDNVTIKSFNIIYKATEYLEEEREKRIKREKTERVNGSAKVLKVFSSKKTEHLIGGALKEGQLKTGDRIKITNPDETVVYGKLMTMQQAKAPIQVLKDGEFGAMVEVKGEIQEGGLLESFEIAYE